MEEAATNTISTLLSTLGTVVTKIFGWVPTLFTTITSNDLLMLAVGVSITGVVISMAIGIFKRV